MRTTDPKKINLSTQPAELLATMRAETDVAWYHFRSVLEELEVMLKERMEKNKRRRNDYARNQVSRL